MVSKKRSMPKEGAPLSNREEQVARRVVDMTTQEIADDLGLAFDTIKLHLARIRNKLGVKRTIQIATWAALNLSEGGE